MPVAKPPINEMALPSRSAKVLPETDVLVVGGGPAGIGAAIGAAEAGAHVLLVERYGFLGGNTTAGLVLTWASYYTSPKPDQGPTATPTLFPSVPATGKPVIAGVVAKLVERLVKAGGAVAPSAETGYVVPIDPEAFKQVTVQMLEEAHVELLLHAFASGVLVKDDLRGVVFETKSGPVVAWAKTVVDCTGDGDVAALLGAPFEVGRREDGLVQPMTLMFLMSNFSRSAFEGYVKEYPNEWNGVQGLKTFMNQAIAKGELNVPRENILFFGTMHDSDISVNSTRVTDTLGTDVWDLTASELEGRRQMMQLDAFLRKYVPGFQKAYLSQSAAHVCVRETRRIVGEYVLTAEDVLEAHKFSDVIAHGAYPIDIHNPKGKGTVLKRVQAGEAYDIPLRCLVPLRVENLLVAGRCISGTHEALASYRVMPISMATGQAAGICAAIASKKGLLPRKVKAQDVQRELLRQGAYLEIDPHK